MSAHRRTRRRCDRKLGRHHRAGLDAAVPAADPARPADRLVAAAAAVLVVGGARRHSRRQWGPDPWHVLLFLIGAIVMRGAGCTWNDLIDRDIDARVERTRSRPIPVRAGEREGGGRVPGGAGAGRACWCWCSSTASPSCSASLRLRVVAIYPLMKRVTYWPQIFLGLAFSWGALMGWAAVFGRLDLPAYLLYAGSIAWVIHYDTIYAHQDSEDDALVGSEIDRAAVRRAHQAGAARCSRRWRWC